MLAAVLLLSALSIRPDLHESVHEHAHEEDHSCAVVLFSQGIEPAVDSAVADHLASLVPVGAVPREAGPYLVRFSHLQPPGRAPPVGMVC